MGDTVKLMTLLDEIAGDMAMVSFIADAPKCVTVTNPVEIYGRGRRARRRRQEIGEGRKGRGQPDALAGKGAPPRPAIP